MPHFWKPTDPSCEKRLFSLFNEIGWDAPQSDTYLPQLASITAFSEAIDRVLATDSPLFSMNFDNEALWDPEQLFEMISSSILRLFSTFMRQFPSDVALKSHMLKAALVAD